MATIAAPTNVVGKVVQIAGPGPFAITYVNPADDPSKQAAK